MASDRRILVFAYYSIMDPVFKSAVLAYFERMILSESDKVVLLTFEHNGFELTEDMEIRLTQYLSSKNIEWKKLVWHSGKFKLIKKIYDLITSLIYGSWLIRKYRLNLVYSEGFPGAILGNFLSVFNNRPHVVHTFEPHADYMLEGGTWHNKNWEYKLLKYMERKVAKKAKALVTATSAYKESLANWSIADKIKIIPSCIDLDRYTYSEENRLIKRKKHSIPEDSKVLVYLGKFGGMYLEEEFFVFLKDCEQVSEYDFYYWIFTSNPVSEVEQLCETYSIPEEKVRIECLAPENVAGELSACDAGIMALKTLPSRRFSSPIKTGEYWACGLPIIIPKGISDDYQIVEREGGGVVVSELKCDKVNWSTLFSYPKNFNRSLASKYRSLEMGVNDLIKVIDSSIR